MERNDYAATAVWVGIIITVALFWTGVGAGVYWLFFDKGSGVACTKPAVYHFTNGAVSTMRCEKR